MLQPLEPHHLADALGRAPPQHGTIDEGTAERLECASGETLAFIDRHLRKTLLEIDARHAAALGDQPEERRANAVADRGERTERQSVHEPHERENDSAHWENEGGLAPAGTL